MTDPDNGGVSFTFRLMKVALIVMHTLVATGLSLLIMLAFFSPNGSLPIGFLFMFIEINSWLGIVGAHRESRPLLIFTGSVTLIVLLSAIFMITNRQDTTFPFVYFLTIVGLSYALADMIRTRRLRAQTGDTEAQTTTRVSSGHAFPTAVPFTALVVGPAMRSTLPSRAVPVFATPEPPTAPFNDSPPAYDDCPPPKYEDVIKDTVSK